jgi:hypothetical protein
METASKTEEPTKTVKPRRKKERSYVFHGTAPCCGGELVEVVETGPRSRHSSFYVVQEVESVSSSGGGRCFLWQKVARQGERNDGPYHAHLGDQARRFPPSCDCRGSLHHTQRSGVPCRHLQGSRELITFLEGVAK